MRLLFALLAFSAVLAAQNVSQADSLAQGLVPPGANYTLSNFTHAGSVSYAVISGGEIQGFLLPGFQGRLSVSLDSGGTESALYDYYVSQGYSPQALSLFSSVHAGINSIKTSHFAGEQKCRVLIGTDRSPCYDFLSCQKACYTVTSFCLPMALGVGRPFIEEIWKFENSSRELASAYENESVAYADVSGNATQWNALSYLAALVEVNRAATRASQSQLYTGYSFCFSPVYSLPALTSYQQAAQQAYQNASKFYGLEDEAQRISERTLSGMSSHAAQEFLPRGNGSQNSSAGESGNASQPENSTSNETAAPSHSPPSPMPDLLLPAAIAAAAAAIAAAAFVILRRKRSRL